MRQQESRAVVVAARRGSDPEWRAWSAAGPPPAAPAALLASSPGPAGQTGAPFAVALCACSCLVVIRSSQCTAAPSHLLGGSAGHTASFSAAAALAPQLEFTLSARVKFKLFNSRTLYKTVRVCFQRAWMSIAGQPVSLSSLRLSSIEPWNGKGSSLMKTSSFSEAKQYNSSSPHLPPRLCARFQRLHLTRPISATSQDCFKPGRSASC